LYDITLNHVQKQVTSTLEVIFCILARLVNEIEFSQRAGWQSLYLYQPARSVETT